MAIVHIDYIINEMHENGLNCWNVRDGKSLLAEQDDDAKDVAASAAMLKDKIKAIGAGYVTINLSGVAKKNRKAGEALKVRTYTVATGYATDSKSMPVAGITVDDKELKALRMENEALKLKALEFKYQSKLDDLQKKIEGLENGDDTGLGRLEAILMPIITNIVGNGLTPAKTAINGVKEENLIDEWLAVDPEAGKVLEKIVNLAITNPTMYKQYKPIILSL